MMYDDPDDPPRDEQPNECDVYRSVDGADPRGRQPTRGDLQLPSLPGAFTDRRHRKGAIIGRNNAGEGRKRKR